jgi:hypothetical protein
MTIPTAIVTMRRRFFLALISGRAMSINGL